MERSSASSRKSETKYILLVDNKNSDVFTCSMLLQRFDYRVCTSNTVRQALEMISVAVPCLIIADIHLPGMSGLDLLSLLKLDPRTSEIPVIFLLQTPDGMNEHRCLEAGAYACINKPIEAEMLFKTVQAAVESHPRGNIRIPIKLMVSVNKKSLDIIEGECASVLSEHGMYVRTRSPYRKDEQLSVELNVNGRLIPADAVVLYCHRYNDGPFREPGMGLKFTRMEKRDREFIRDFIRNEITHGIV
ncbi:MAG TPA: response regulator [Nitrospirota bacterium]|nr:response regulator [Nitrospirota bacterium]